MDFNILHMYGYTIYWVMMTYSNACIALYICNCIYSHNNTNIIFQIKQQRIRGFPIYFFVEPANKCQSLFGCKLRHAYCPKLWKILHTHTYTHKHTHAHKHMQTGFLPSMCKLEQEHVWLGKPSGCEAIHTYTHTRILPH